MIRVAQNIRIVALLIAIALFLIVVPAASADAIQGVVTDSASKPVRGAIVKAKSGFKSVSRYTDKNERFQITGLKPGVYEVSAAAFGLGPKTESKDSAQAGEVKFSLSPDTDPTHLTS